MYSLREINRETGIEKNFSLGDGYTVVSRSHSPEQFAEVFKQYWLRDLEEQDNTHDFVLVDSTDKIIPLIKGSAYFVMTDTGKTFDNLSFRG